MCGRTACTLCAESVARACEYKDSETGKRKEVYWQSLANADREYLPSYNMAPTDVTPCIVSGSHFSSERKRVLYPMMWGMIPPWHKGDYKKHGLSSHNCRLEGLPTSKLYSPPLSRGRRCVIICDGYYEWKTTDPKKKGPKQPYFIYAPQRDNIKIEDPTTWTEKWSEDEGWTGIKILKLAGLFDSWESPEGETIYSYTMLTMAANKELSWLHHRVPVFLETEEDVTAWLNYKKVPVKDALARLHGPSEGTLKWHPVDPMVNNSRCKSIDCNKPIKLEEKKKSAPTGLMASWLKKGTPVKRGSDEFTKNDGKSEEPDEKRHKVE